MDRRRNSARVQGYLESPPTHGLRVLACRFSIRWKAFSGFCPPCSHRQGEAGSSGSQVQLRFTIREERDDGRAHRVDIGLSTRVCLRVTRERQRSARFGEGSSRSEKVHGESASSALNKAPVLEVRRIMIG